MVLSSNSNTLFTGPRFLDVPFATQIFPGNYWLAIGASTGSATNNASMVSFSSIAMAMSLAGVSQSNVSVGILGAATAASDQGLFVGNGVFNAGASAFTTASIGMAQVSQVVSNPMLPFQFIRQA
jgi:hypothetical protein